MKNDLISRAAAIEAVERREPMLIGDKRVNVESFKTFLRNRPAVDAEPVRHGRWEDFLSDPYCTVCDEFSEYKTNYCPNCGAKMDLEEEM